MRMYLSSFKLGNKPQALQQLVGSDRRAVIVMNALDNLPDQLRGQWDSLPRPAGRAGSGRERRYNRDR
jgi:hypothetical protein